MKAMILAAGRGERMGNLTRHQPKPLLKVGQYTLIDHHLKASKKEGFTEIVINVWYFADQIMQHVGDGKQWGLKIQYSRETHLLGTGGGPRHAADLLGKEPFLLVSCDILLDYANLDVKVGLEKMKSRHALAHIWLVDNPPYHPKGDLVLSYGRISKYGMPRLNYAGVSWMDPLLLEDVHPGTFEITQLWHKAMQEGFITGDFYSGRWFNMGTPAILSQARKAYGE